MIFNDEYNNIIEIMIGFDKDFERDFNNFVKKLPVGIPSKCKKMKFFDTTRGDENYKFNEFNNNELELIVENSTSFNHALNLYKLDTKILRDMESGEQFDFGVFETTKPNGECLGYLFSINKIKNTYHLKVHCESDNPSDNKDFQKRIDMGDLIKRINSRKR